MKTIDNNKALGLLTNYLFVTTFIASVGTLYLLLGFSWGKIIGYVFILLYFYSVYLLIVKSRTKPLLITNFASLFISQVYFFASWLILPSGDKAPGNSGSGTSIAIGFIIMIMVFVLPVFISLSAINLHVVFDKGLRDKAILSSLVAVSILAACYLGLYLFL